MTKSFRCKFGIHKWSKATYVDHSIKSNILDWKQKCLICKKKMTWVQPKGLNEKFYPIYWTKRKSWLFWIFLIVIIILIVKFIF